MPTRIMLTKPLPRTACSSAERRQRLVSGELAVNISGLAPFNAVSDPSNDGKYE